MKFQSDYWKSSLEQQHIYINLQVVIEYQYLEVKMVNSCKSTQAVVTQSKIRIISFHCHVKCKQEALTVNPLGQTLKYAWNQQNMPILNRTHLLRK